ncbi:MAG: hypothetical protein MUE81_01355 [Thermoflexibacter sp.]|nr:hypothetical protein [Thermoflexibacter sp.]
MSIKCTKKTKGQYLCEYVMLDSKFTAKPKGKEKQIKNARKHGIFITL